MRHRIQWAGAGLLLLLLASVACIGSSEPTPVPTEALTFGWTDAQLATITSLWLGSLPDLPPDPSNRVADDPAAVELGHALYFDPRLSADGTISCATCHEPERYFTDGKPLPEGLAVGPRHTPTIVGMAYSPWYYWDGRRDSQWAQAISPLEQDIEHGGTRVQYARLLAEDPAYSAAYQALFGPLPDLTGLPVSAGPRGSEAEQAAWAALSPVVQTTLNEVLANVGKALAAYERQIMPGPAPFDDYVAALLDGNEAGMRSALNPDAEAGLRLFIGQGNCTQCHNGPLFTNNSFHSIGLPVDAASGIDQGRIAGVQEALTDPFNCLGAYSDAAEDECPELTFVKTEGTELIGSFKVPTLRNVAETAPYSHDGRFASLLAILAHYNAAPPPLVGHSDLIPLGLTSEELAQLAAFLDSLTGPLDVDPALLAPP